MNEELVIAPHDIRAHPSLRVQSAIDDALASLPAELQTAPGAFVAFQAEADLERVEVAVYARLENGWSFGGIVEREWRGGNLTARAQVLKVWGL